MIDFRARLTGGVSTPDDLAADLAAAASGGELFAVYQPQISLETGLTVAAETLCRWRHPRLGLIAPDSFIQLAEHTGAIHDLGRYILDEALSAADEWHAAGSDLDVSVNVSPVQLESTAFTEHLTAEFSRRSLAPRRLTIEITESLPLVDAGTVMHRLRELRAIGVGISLDDFGTGHASLEQLTRLPLTEVKLDGELIRGARSGSLEQLVEVVEIAHDRGLCVVAEGIETLTHLETAVEIGADRAQGYLTGQPRPRSQLSEF